MSVLEFQIYALVDSQRGDAVFYIGQSIDTARRLRQHIDRARNTGRNEPVTQYVRGMLEAGDEPNVVVLHRGVGGHVERKRLEDQAILFFLEIGEPLCNTQEGGQAGYQHSLTTRRKMAEAVRSAHATPKIKRKMSEAAKEKWQEPKTREQMLEASRQRGARMAGFDRYEELVERDAEVLALYEAGTERSELASRFGLKPGDISNAIGRARKRAGEDPVDRETRAAARRALVGPRTHCKHGHAWEENKMWDAVMSTWRCKQCRHESRQRHEEKKASTNEDWLR